MARLAPRLPDVRAVGAEMLFVGNGSAKHAAAFRKDQGVPDLPLVTDPGRKTYRAAGMVEGVGKVASLGTMKNAVRALGRGHMQGRTRGHPWQNGGIVVLDAKGHERWKFVQQNAGDTVDADTILAELAAATRPRKRS